MHRHWTMHRHWIMHRHWTVYRQWAVYRPWVVAVFYVLNVVLPRTVFSSDDLTGHGAWGIRGSLGPEEALFFTHRQRVLLDQTYLPQQGVQPDKGTQPEKGAVQSPGASVAVVAANRSTEWPVSTEVSALTVTGILRFDEDIVIWINNTRLDITDNPWGITGITHHDNDITLLRINGENITLSASHVSQ